MTTVLPGTKNHQNYPILLANCHKFGILYLNINTHPRFSISAFVNGKIIKAIQHRTQLWSWDGISAPNNLYPRINIESFAAINTSILEIRYDHNENKEAPMLNMQRGLEYSLWKMDGVRSWMLVGNGLCPFDYGSLFSLT